MSEEDLNTYKKYVSDLDITKYIVLDSESNYWYSAEYVDKMLKKQDKEIERLNKEIESWIKLINYNEIEDIPQYIEDLEVDNKSLKKENKEINKENKRLNNIIKEIEKCIDYYAIENDDFSKFYNNEEIEILKIIGSDKVE